MLVWLPLLLYGTVGLLCPWTSCRVGSVGVVVREALVRCKSYLGGVRCSTIVTASEDHALRFWCWDTGAPLSRLEAHLGRGVWRCAVAPLPQATLITGGGDCALRQWDLAAVLGNARDRQAPCNLAHDGDLSSTLVPAKHASMGSCAQMNLCIPLPIAHSGCHSARESVKAMAFGGMQRVYVLLVGGQLLRADLAPPGPQAPAQRLEWQRLWVQAAEGEPVSCLAVRGGDAHDDVALGTRAGSVLLARCAHQRPAGAPIMVGGTQSCGPAPIVSVYLPASLEPHHVLIATSAPKLLWCDLGVSGCQVAAPDGADCPAARIVASCRPSGRSSRISAAELLHLDCDTVLVMGDSLGGVYVYGVPAVRDRPAEALSSGQVSCADPQGRALAMLASLPGLHAAKPVQFLGPQVEPDAFLTAGRDGALREATITTRGEVWPSNC